MSRPTTKLRQSAFLAAFSETGNIWAAARKAKIARSNHYEWLLDPLYVDAFATASEEACELLEKEARRRAVNGVLEPIMYKGKRVALVRKHSDLLLIFLMKGCMPAKYRDNAAVELTGKGGADLQMQVVFVRPDPVPAG